MLEAGHPGSPRPSLPGRPRRSHWTKKEPNDAAVIGEAPPATAQPAFTSQLQNTADADDALPVRGPPVFGPHVLHTDHPHRVLPLRILHDPVWRQTEITLAEQQLTGSMLCFREGIHKATFWVMQMDNKVNHRVKSLLKCSLTIRCSSVVKAAMLRQLLGHCCPKSSSVYLCLYCIMIFDALVLAFGCDDKFSHFSVVNKCKHVLQH